MLSDPPESSLTCFSLVLRTLLCVFILAFESCLRHVQLVGILVEELVPYKLGSELRSSEFLAALLLVGLCLEAGTLSLGVCTSEIFCCEKIHFFFSS